MFEKNFVLLKAESSKTLSPEMRLLLPALDEGVEVAWQSDEARLCLNCYGIGSRIKITLLSLLQNQVEGRPHSPKSSALFKTLTEKITI